MEKHERLKRAREARFATAKEAASYLRMPYSTLAHHEAGTRGIKDDELAAYASAYRVNLAWLDHGEEMSPRERQLIEHFRALSEAEQDFMLAGIAGWSGRPAPPDDDRKKGRG